MGDKSPPGQGFPYKKDGDARRFFWGLKAVLVSLRLFSLKRSQGRAFAVPFRILRNMCSFQKSPRVNRLSYTPRLLIDINVSVVVIRPPSSFLTRML